MAPRLLFHEEIQQDYCAMNKPLRILHLEDDPDYCDLVQSLLTKDGFAVDLVLVQNRADFEGALAPGRFDIILADYLLPSYNGLEGLRVAREKCPETPFLLVSGTIGEQAAIESLQAGATDYVLKTWPERLVPAMRRAVGEADERMQRRRIETELRRREKHFRALTDNALDILTILDREGRFSHNSPSVKRVLGYGPGELTGQNAFALIHPEDLPGVLLGFESGLRNPDRTIKLEFRFRHWDGSWRYLEAVGQSRLDDPDITGVVVNSRDISDRKQAEAGLRESEKRFRDLFEGSPDAIFVEDLHGTVLDINPAACRLHGVTREELIGRKVLDLVPPDQREQVARDFQALVEGRLQHVEGASRMQDGRAVPVEVRASRIKYATQEAVLLHVHDITDRKLAEAALRSSEMLFHSVWENSVDGMRLTDENGTTVAVNDAFCRLVALPREDLEGKPFTKIFADTELPERMLEEFRQRFRDRIVEQQKERRLRLHNGSVVTLEHTSSFVELRGQPSLLLGQFRDLTAQKRLEEQLRQSQKMEAIGQLAGGVAHDFNNILTIIHGHASLLLAGGGLAGGPAKSAQQISQAAERAAGLTRQLLAFGRRQVMQPRQLDMNEVVGNMTKMLGRILGEDIALRLHYSTHPALVEADAGMLEQVLMNLSVNSRDAMPKGGLLAIKIAAVSVDASHTAEHPEACVGHYICLSVADTGGGIPPENLRRIFEPFFTTKELGKGTGLGLATVYGIVKQHRGWIEVESEIGRGTAFKVFLPLSGETAQIAHAQPSEKPARGGTETILVVEDEAPVRELVCNILAGHGYRVLQAESGARALQVWQDSKGKIDLLVTDLVMPDRLNGRELAEKLWTERPRLKVIFTSGYSADAVGKDFVLRRGLNYLQKPYHPGKLALAVRDCLDAVN
jgi:two-component system, cell cycle sensor histidine kinase and response regulator CckA